MSELGNISTMEAGIETGKRWKMIGEEEKQKYMIEYKEKMKQYKLEKLNYDMKSREQAGSTMVKFKMVRDPLAPKLPLSSYMEFVRLERPKVIDEIASPSLIEVGLELERRWNSLSQADKEVDINISKDKKK